MKVLIFGGTGAMGVHLTRILADMGHDALVTSRSERAPDNPRIRFLRGDAHDRSFLEQCLQERPDAVVDFMNYPAAKFQTRRDLILNSVGQYLFLSSARVYAQSETPLTEDSPRLLDVTTDAAYLKTTEYALEKARSENFLRDARQSNWTIVRPYITYSVERLQLGIMEKECWLYRALHGRSIVFSKDIAQRTTTLTYGGDVALRMTHLIGREKALGECFHIASSRSVLWSDVLRVYVETLERCTGVKPNVILTDSGDDTAAKLGAYYQLHYDRLYDRVFDSGKTDAFLRLSAPYKNAEDGLAACLEAFLSGSRTFRQTNGRLERYFDGLTKERTPLSEISGWKQKLKYMIG